jgi:DNA-binding HxlR family transcriptional regulator
MQPIELDNCPLRRSLRALGGKWNLIIIKVIGKQELRFNEISRGIPDVSEKVLIDKLKVLVAEGIVIRKNFNEVPPRVSYRLTERGTEALRIVGKLETFGEMLNTEVRNS